MIFLLLFVLAIINRQINQDYKRLTFALIGVATPSDLIQDHKRTPFNIGRAIKLTGFTLEEVKPLVKGLELNVENPIKILKEILCWTNGQPFLTQKLCSLIRNSDKIVTTNQEAQFVKDLVENNIIKDWQIKDNPETFKNNSI